MLIGLTQQIVAWRVEFMQPRRGRCPHRPVANGMISPKTCGNRTIFPRGDVGIAPYGLCVFETSPAISAHSYSVMIP